MTESEARVRVPAVPPPSNRNHGLMALASRDCPFPIVPWSEAPSWNSWGGGIGIKGSESLGVGHGGGGVKRGFRGASVEGRDDSGN
jgi:hypothetical protein